MKKIIYIENELLLRNVIKEMAKNLGHIAYVYDSSEDLSFYLKDIEPDLVLIDLPSIGEKTKLLIGAIETIAPNAKIWATGWESKVSSDLKPQVLEYFPKPFDPNLLLSKYFEL